MANLIKTGFLLIVLTCLLVLVGGALGGQQGMTIAFILALVMNVGSYWFSDKIVLSMYGAQPVEMAQWGAIFGGGRRDDEEGGGGGLGMIGVLIMAILAPFAALLIQMAISRSREYEADASGARLVGKASGLAHALEKLETASQQNPLPASPATAHLFIVNPLTSGGLASLFSTHPPIEERIARLQAMKL